MNFNNITISKKDGATFIKYYKTIIVQFSENLILLNTGGWFTASTKAKMNGISESFDLGFKVFQKNSKWFVDYKNEKIPFSEAGACIIGIE